MRFETPTIVDYGSIARHTFGVSTPVCTPGQADPPKDHNVCKLDCHGEYSCS